MKDIFNIYEFQTLDTSNIVIETTPSSNEVSEWIELDSIKGTPTIEIKEFLEIYNERLLEALSEGEQYILEIEGIIELEGFELKVIGYKYNYSTNKIELILE